MEIRFEDLVVTKQTNHHPFTIYTRDRVPCRHDERWVVMHMSDNDMRKLMEFLQSYFQAGGLR